MALMLGLICMMGGPGEGFSEAERTRFGQREAQASSELAEIRSGSDLLGNLQGRLGKVGILVLVVVAVAGLAATVILLL